MAAVYDKYISRSDAADLIPTQYSREIINGVIEDSAVLRLARRLPNMTAKQLKMPVLNSLPYAYFVDGDTGLKQTTGVDWTNKTITAEEIAVIVPVPDAVLADAEYDMWAQINPLVRAAFGQAIDNAILYGTNKPTSWPNGIVTQATAAGNVVTETADGYADIMEKGGLIDLVEQNGFLINGYLGGIQARAYLRGIRDDNGQPIFRDGMRNAEGYTLDGQRIIFPINGAMAPTGYETPMLIAGDWSQLVYAIRQDMTVTRTNQAVITDATGAVVYNLFQQDMTALRFVMRLGWQLPTPAVTMIGVSNPFPFAVLETGEEPDDDNGGEGGDGGDDNGGEQVGGGEQGGGGAGTGENVGS